MPIPPTWRTETKPRTTVNLWAVVFQASHHLSHRLPLPLCLLPQASVQVMAKSLIRNRHAVTKMYGLKSQLQSVSLRLAVGVFTPTGAAAMSCSNSLPLLHHLHTRLQRSLRVSGVWELQRRMFITPRPRPSTTTAGDAARQNCKPASRTGILPPS